MPHAAHRRRATLANRAAVRSRLRLMCLATACACAGLTAAPLRAQIYVGQTINGATGPVVLSNFQSEQTPQLLVAAPGAPEVAANSAPTTAPRGTAAADAGTSPSHGSAPGPRRMPAAPPAIARLVAEVAAEVGLAPGLLHAVIAAESAYNPKALSARGAMGLMQLMPATARRFGARDAYEPRQNVRAGALYLRRLLADFGGDLELALAAYNSGEQAVLNAGRRIPPYPETRAYVPRVLGYLQCAVDAQCDAPKVGRIHPLAHGGAPTN
jgi:soluble lytic murein transglycosylase-like protein